MSRNRCSTTCDCGYELGIKDAFTIPLSFDQYLRIALRLQDPMTYRYYYEFYDVIMTGVMCPRCEELYALWTGGIHHVKEDRNLPPYYGKYPVRLDTSYWTTFDDEK